MTTRVTVRTLKDAIVIPQAAIITSTRGTSVYVMGEDQAARAVPVTRLHAFGLSAVVSGLNGDEKVITEGKQNLRPGGKVRLAEAARGGSDGDKGNSGGKGSGKGAGKDAAPVAITAAAR